MHSRSAQAEHISRLTPLDAERRFDVMNLALKQRAVGAIRGRLPAATSKARGGRHAKIAAAFHGGSGHCEVVKMIQQGDLVMVVMVEWNDVAFADGAETQPWVLRTTQVFRRDKPGHWLRLHRHADPLIRRPRAEDRTS